MNRTFQNLRGPSVKRKDAQTDGRALAGNPGREHQGGDPRTGV